MATGVDRINTTKIELSSYKSSVVKLKRHSIESVRGNPIQTSVLSDGNELAVYMFKEYGDEGSLLRAGGHAVMNVITVGLWELVGTPIEHGINTFKGREFRSSVIYNQNNEAVDVRLEQKVLNTMDIVVDFKNERYRIIGR
ncbi:MAG: hypothetical protein COV35_03625 [Alphaproteobacteria bacterium CG11_big_fil_rev_8_21_14_0_20_39_49]|nr:MAG: hypothetical protein COV35_03625 [Alphaproteobacteria bacterium CG11_big_fil_rev_8_21_14_0_20_39_49]